MPFKQDEWITHPKYGSGQIQEVTDKRYLIRFVSEGVKEIITSFTLVAGHPPKPDFKFPSFPKAAKGALKPGSKTLRPAVAFSHLLERFLSKYPGGFNDSQFIADERDYKLAAADLLKATLNRDALKRLIDAGDFETVRKVAQSVATSTNLIFPIELAKMSSGLKTPEAKAAFAKALFSLLYGEDEFSTRFDSFASVLGELGFAIWTVATIFPFFATHGASMFMKISVSKFIAASVEVPLEYETVPNSRTYEKLQQVASETTSRLRTAGYEPRDGFDTQSFMFVAWFEIEGINQRNRATASKAKGA
jgi:hypothetical protein